MSESAKSAGSPPAGGSGPGDGSRLEWAWVLGGFLLVVLAGVVVWLAIAVADLRGEVRGELDVVATAAPPEAVPIPPKVPAATAQAAPRTAGDRAGRTMPAKAPGDVDAGAPQQRPGVVTKTAGELGLPHLPPDTEVQVAMDSEGGGERDLVGTEDGFVSREAFEKEGYRMQNYPYTASEFKSRLTEMYPDTATALTPDEVGAFQDVVRKQYGAEAALLKVLKSEMSQEAMSGLLAKLGAAVKEKWEMVGPTSTAEQFAKADAHVLRAAASVLPPELYGQMEQSLRDGSAFDEVPQEGELQEIPWVARSLMNRGLTATVEESESMRNEVNVPPPPPGVQPDDPEYQKYVQEYRESRRQAKAHESKPR